MATVGRFMLPRRQLDNGRPDRRELESEVSGEVVGVVPTGRGPAGMALDALRRRAYVAISGEDTISAIGLLEYRLLQTLRLSRAPAKF